MASAETSGPGMRALCRVAAVAETEFHSPSNRESIRSLGRLRSVESHGSDPFLDSENCSLEVHANVMDGQHE